jgi:hypothetical protein
VRYEIPTPIETHRIIIIRTFPARSPDHICFHTSIERYTMDFRSYVQDLLGAQLVHTLLRGPAKLEFKFYGWFQSCQCGSSRDGFEKVANNMEFPSCFDPIDASFEFFPLGEVSSCVACGE